MKNVLLFVHGDAGQEARLQCALDLTRALAGHLFCMDIVPIPAFAGVEYGAPQAQARLLDDARDIEEANGRNIKSRLKAEDIAWSWRDGMGEIASLLVDVSNLADVVVLNTALPSGEGPDMRSIVSSIVMDSSKPVLAVPPATKKLDVAGEALVAWNGSPPVAETLRAAVPLLLFSAGVKIFQIGEVEGESAEDAAAYLSRHGIHARIERRNPSDSDSDGEKLLDYCRSTRPAYCVMGAYGHGRLRESLFGGVTRLMLKDSPVPLLIGH
jgi:nucleotide-binding universal stress UspA family protein